MFYKSRLITDFKGKAKFYFSFLNNAPWISNNSQLPTNLRVITDKRLTTVTFAVEDFGKIIQNFDLNKVHGHDNISIPRLKISGDFICKPLELIFSKALLTSMIPSKSKRDTISKTWKIIVQLFYFQYVECFFKRRIFNKMFSFFLTNKFISRSQPSLRSGDSCIN